MDGHPPLLRAFDDHTHVTERLNRGEGVFTFEKTLDFGGPFRQGTQHDGTMRNGFVAWDTQMAGQAAARVGEENEVIGMHNVHIGSASQYFAEMFPGSPGAREHAQQPVPVSFIDRGAQGVEVGTKIIQGMQHRLAIGEEDVVPHHRVATGNTGEITKSTRRVTEDLEILMALGERINQTEGQQVRQVTSGGQHLVVVRHVHVLDIGTERRPKPGHQRKRLRIGVLQRSQYDLVAAEQRALGRRDTTELRSGDGMAGNETRRHLAEHVTRAAHHIALGAADIGDHGGAQVELRQLAEQSFQGEDGCGELNNVGVTAGFGQRVGTAIHHAQLDRQFTRAGVQIEADHLAAKAGLTQPLGKRTANQPEPDHHQTIDDRCGSLFHGGWAHCCSTCVSTSRKRAFSRSVPMETRRNVGIP